MRRWPGTLGMGHLVQAIPQLQSPAPAFRSMKLRAGRVGFSGAEDVERLMLGQSRPSKLWHHFGQNYSDLCDVRSGCDASRSLSRGAIMWAWLQWHVIGSDCRWRQRSLFQGGSPSNAWARHLIASLISIERAPAIWCRDIFGPPVTRPKVNAR